MSTIEKAWRQQIGSIVALFLANLVLTLSNSAQQEEYELVPYAGKPCVVIETADLVAANTAGLANPIEPICIVDCRQLDPRFLYLSSLTRHRDFTFA